MAQMFSNASSFNANVGNWDVSQVTDMMWMFYSAKAFSQELCWGLEALINSNSYFLFDYSNGCFQRGCIKNTALVLYQQYYCVKGSPAPMPVKVPTLPPTVLPLPTPFPTSKQPVASATP